MPRARSIKPDFFKDEELVGCGPVAMLLFAGLWTLADREGRLGDRPVYIKAEVFPYTDVPVEDLLGKLAAGRFIIRYESGGKRFISIRSWTKYQHPHMNESASTIPAPEQHHTTSEKIGSPSEEIGSATSGLCILVSGSWSSSSGAPTPSVSAETGSAGMTTTTLQTSEPNAAESAAAPVSGEDALRKEVEEDLNDIGALANLGTCPSHVVSPIVAMLRKARVSPEAFQAFMRIRYDGMQEGRLKQPRGWPWFRKVVAEGVESGEFRELEGKRA